MADPISPALAAARSRTREMASDREAARAEAASLQRDVIALDRLAKERLAVGDRDGAAEADEAARAAAVRRQSFVDASNEIGVGIQELIEGLAIDDLAAEGDVPLALLPVRIETRSTAQRSQLRVRIYPDDLHVDALDRGLSDEERAAGEQYWQARWTRGDGGQDGQDGQPDPWPALVAAAGAARAEWVATRLRPTNLASRPAGTPIFPDTPPRGDGRSIARLLPDRFHVIVDQGGTLSEGVGKAIPDELSVGVPLGPDFTPLDPDTTALPPVDQAMRWMVDYEAALAVGMGVTVRLARPGQHIDRVIVVGLRASLAPVDAAAQFERLLESHRVTTGVAFVPQGTLTNNTDTQSTAWRRGPDPHEPPLTPPPVPTGSNAAVLAHALGIAPASLANVPDGDRIEQPRARAMNAALWASTWGTFLERFFLPPPQNLTTEQQRNDARDHFIEFVRGRGPVPALRIGNQPYGVLPVLPVEASFRALRGGTVEQQLVPFLRRLRIVWQLGVRNVPTMMQGNIDQVLPEILGSSPVMQGLRVRSVVSQNASQKGFPLFDEDPNKQAQLDANALARELVEITATKVNNDGLLSNETRPLALPLAADSDVTFIDALLRNETPHAPESVLQVLLGYAAKQEQHSRGTFASYSEIARLAEVVTAGVEGGGVGGRGVEGIDTRLLRDALHEAAEARPSPRHARQAAAMLKGAVGDFDRDGLTARQPFAALAAPSAFAAVTDQGRNLGSLAVGVVGYQFAGSVLDLYTRYDEFRTAIGIIRDAPTAERALLLSETLDLCSHRLDAWITSVATARLSMLRARGARTLIGAFGWAENIDLVEPTPVAAPPGVQGPVFANPRDGGYIHAPSLTHAATAGILRSGRLSHSAGDADDPTLDIDLSSGRVRQALAILDGIRQGQPLGALLGYRLERWLHERSGGGLELDRFIYVLRGLAPLIAGRLTTPGVPQESLAAADVVDGLRLREMAWPTILAALKAGPADKTYIVAWDQPSVAEANEVRRAIEELDRVHDAVADLLLAEGVHQLVKGNPLRAAAALDAIGGGEAVPPDPDVVRTPRSGVAFTHRVALLAPDPIPVAIAGWNTATPRAQAEPRLEAWAQRCLGDPRAIVLTADALGVPTRFLADADLCALDVIYDADGADWQSSSLGQRLKRALANLGDDLRPFAQTWELARALRAAMLAGRPALPAVFGRTLDPELLDRADAAIEVLDEALSPVDENTAPLAVLDALAPFGIGGAAHGRDLAAIEPAVAAAAARAKAIARQESAAKLRTAAAVAKPESILAIFSAIFGEEFVVLPVAEAPTAADPFSAAVGPAGTHPRDGRTIRPWLTRMAAVRPSLSRYSDTILIREARGERVRLDVAQTPVGAAPRWIALDMPLSEAIPDQPISATVFEHAFGEEAADGEAPLAALILDEWTDVVARRVKRSDGATETIETVTTTGIALNANGPNARAPQAVLIAISPDRGAWNKDRLVATLRDTMQLMRERAVTLERVPWAGRILPALYFRDWSLQGEPVIDWRLLSELHIDSTATMFVREGVD